MIKQNDSGLYLDIQAVGCFFMAAIDLAMMEAKKRNLSKWQLSIRDINSLWEKAKAFRYIDEKNNMLNSAKVANLACEALGLPCRIVEVATDTGHTQWYSGIGEHRVDYRIEKILQSGKSKTHFRIVDSLGGVIEDPHNPPIKKLASYYKIYYRVDEV